MLMEGDEASAVDWLDRVEWPEPKDDLIAQLKIGRAAITYLARTIDIREARRKWELEAGGKPIPTLPASNAHTEHAEFG